VDEGCWKAGGDTGTRWLGLAAVAAVRGEGGGLALGDALTFFALELSEFFGCRVFFLLSLVIRCQGHAS
jgi:hypothetical protein